MKQSEAHKYFKEIETEITIEQWNKMRMVLQKYMKNRIDDTFFRLHTIKHSTLENYIQKETKRMYDFFVSVLESCLYETHLYKVHPIFKFANYTTMFNKLVNENFSLDYFDGDSFHRKNADKWHYERAKIVIGCTIEELDNLVEDEKIALIPIFQKYFDELKNLDCSSDKYPPDHMILLKFYDTFLNRFMKIKEKQKIGNIQNNFQLVNINNEVILIEQELTETNNNIQNNYFQNQPTDSPIHLIRVENIE